MGAGGGSTCSKNLALSWLPAPAFTTLAPPTSSEAWGSSSWKRLSSLACTASGTRTRLYCCAVKRGTMRACARNIHWFQRSCRSVMAITSCSRCSMRLRCHEVAGAESFRWGHLLLDAWGHQPGDHLGYGTRLKRYTKHTKEGLLPGTQLWIANVQIVSQLSTCRLGQTIIQDTHRWNSPGNGLRGHGHDSELYRKAFSWTKAFLWRFECSPLPPFTNGID